MAEQLRLEKSFKKTIEWALVCGVGPGEIASEIMRPANALRAVKQRLHQASFRKAGITAYDGRCALSGLPECFRLFTFTQNFDLPR